MKVLFRNSSLGDRLRLVGRKFFYSLGLLVMLTACTSVQLGYVNLVARFSEYRRIADIAYGEKYLQELDLYLPASAKPSRACVVFFYGGCWGACHPLTKEYYRFVAQALTDSGYAVAIVDYRQYPDVKFAEIMQDAVESVRLIKAKASEYAINPNNILLMGHSAGAHIAAMLALNPRYLGADTYPSIKGFIGLAGPYDFLPFTEEYQFDLFGPSSRYPASQPVNFVHTGEPPLLLLHGIKDDIVKLANLESLTNKASQIGGCVKTRTYSELDHKTLLGALSLPMQAEQPVLADVVSFADQVLTGQSCRS